MRLTGHMPEPLEGEKWPLEIRVKGGDHLLGMRRFTLEPPEFRGFQAEGFFLDHLRREGVLVPRFSLLEVTRNGLNIGLMGMEELPSTELLVSQGRKSGAIIRFDDSSYWEAYRTGRQTPFDSPFTARIQAVNEDEIAESSRLQENLESATGLLRGFLAGSLRASEVFDVELLGRFLAVAEIWRTREALVWRNARYYFNPLNARMSPIGNRGNLHSPYLGDQLVSLSQPYTTQLLDDPTVRDAFARALQRIANEVADGTILEELAQAEKTRLAILHR